MIVSFFLSPRLSISFARDCGSFVHTTVSSHVHPLFFFALTFFLFLVSIFSRVFAYIRVWASLIFFFKLSRTRELAALLMVPTLEGWAWMLDCWQAEFVFKESDCYSERGCT